MQNESPNINQILCFFNSTIMQFSQLRHLIKNTKEAEEKIINFAKYAGPVSQNIVLYIYNLS